MFSRSMRQVEEESKKSHLPMSGEFTPVSSTISRPKRRQLMTSVGVSECIDNTSVSTTMLPEPFQIPLRVSERLAGRQTYTSVHSPIEQSAMKAEVEAHKEQELCEEFTKEVSGDGDSNEDEPNKLNKGKAHEHVYCKVNVQRPLIANPSWRREMFMSSVHKWSNDIQDRSGSHVERTCDNVTEENTQAGNKNNDNSECNASVFATNRTKRARAEIGDEFISFNPEHMKKKTHSDKVQSEKRNDANNQFTDSHNCLIDDDNDDDYESISSGVLSSVDSNNNDDEIDSNDTSDDNSDENNEKASSSSVKVKWHRHTRVRDLSQHDKVLLEEHLRTFDNRYLEQEEAVLYKDHNSSDDSDHSDSDGIVSSDDDDDDNDNIYTNNATNINEESENHKQWQKNKDEEKLHHLNGCRRFRDVYFECYNPSEVHKIQKKSFEGKPIDNLYTTKDNTHHENCSYMAHHTLLGLRGPVTINGPCGIVGLSRNEVSVNGFYLGGKQLTVWLSSQRVELLPVSTLSDKSLKMNHVPSYVKASRKVHSEMVKQLITQHNFSILTSKDEKKLNEHCSTQKTTVPGRGVVLHPSMFESNLLAKRFDVNKENHSNNGIHKNDNEDDKNAFDKCNTLTSWDPSTLYDVERVFGAIDWAWVEQTLQSWNTMNILAKVKAVVLIVQLNPDKSSTTTTNKNETIFLPLRQFPCRPRHVNRIATAEAATTRAIQEDKEEERYTNILNSKKKRKHSIYSSTNGHAESSHQELGNTETSTVSHMYIPSFISRGRVTGIDQELHERVIPAIASVRSGVAAMVVGSVNMGKSTLLRSLANTLISQHGSCFWADFDAGQSEFGVPGELSLYQLHYPLLQPNDFHHASHITSFFIGTCTLSCPLITSQAIAALCEVINKYIAPHAPLVVNTHGWVLETGRRVTLEIMRRLQPQHVVYLKEQKELSWLTSSETVMPSAVKRGLNANVVARRFLVRADCVNETLLNKINNSNNNKSKKKKSTINNHVEQHCCCLLPYAHTTTPNNSSKNHSSNKNENEICNITIHAIQVNREDWSNSYSNTSPSSPSSSSLYRSQTFHKHVGYGMVQSRSKARQMYWQQYFDLLIRFYETTHFNERVKDNNNSDHIKHTDGANRNSINEEYSDNSYACNTTLITAKLKELSNIVIASVDELEVAPRLQEVAAMLEHAVVAVQFHWHENKTKTTTCELNTSNTTNCVGNNNTLEFNEQSTSPIEITSLSAWRSGFEVSCYGYVESVEQELLGLNDNLHNKTVKNDSTDIIGEGGTIAIRVPFAPSTIKAMMSSIADINVQLMNECKQKNSASISSQMWSVGVAIAYSPALRHDTSFLEHYPNVEESEQ